MEIRPMGEDYILDRCYQQGPWNPFDPNDASAGVLGTSCGALGDLKFGAEWQAFHRDLLEQHGNGAFIAWDDDKIAGWINFFPKKVAQEHKSEGVPADSDLLTEVLVIGCLQVVFDSAYQGKGIGSGLVTQTLDFARGQGYERLEVHAVHSGLHPFLWYWSSRSGRSFWENLGFQVLRQSNAEEAEAEREKFKQVRDDYQAGDSIPEELTNLLSVPDWEPTFRTYSMAHRLR